MKLKVFAVIALLTLAFSGLSTANTPTNVICRGTIISLKESSCGWVVKVLDDEGGEGFWSFQVAIEDLACPREGARVTVQRVNVQSRITQPIPFIIRIICMDKG